MSVDGNVWYVKLADGDVEGFTLDQLDEAFQNGQIDEASMVLAAGSDKWEKLADLLGGSGADTEDDPLGADLPTPVNAAPSAPIPQPQRPPPPKTGGPSAFVPAPAAVTGTSYVPQAPQPAAPAGPVATVAPAGPAVVSAAPRAVIPPAAAVAPGTVAPVASSLRPFSVDLGSQISLDDASFGRPSKKRWVAVAVGALAIGGAGAFFAVRQTSASAASDPPPPVFTAAAAVAPPPAAATVPPPANPAPAAVPQTSNPGPSPVMDPTQRLSDDQRQRLLESDNKKGRHGKSHGGGSAGGGSHSSSKDKSSAFTTSGNKYDPLNSSL